MCSAKRMPQWAGAWPGERPSIEAYITFTCVARPTNQFEVPLSFERLKVEAEEAGQRLKA